LNPTVWEAFAGLDLGVKPRAYPISIRALAGGVAVEETLILTVRARRFPERRITVAERFARPPASALARIEREAKDMAAILAAVSPGRAWGTAFALPVPGRMTSPFGRLSIVNGEARSPHSGTDFAAPVGTPVKAPHTGRVVLSADLYYAGEAVIVDHGLGVYSMLAHLSRRDVQVGDVLESGQRVGLSGATGRITGPRLHWSIRVAGARVDPLSLVEVSGRRDPELVPQAAGGRRDR
jgi:murein DD-endopeptidase MepM/ murein hydrolase activator NlpD